MVKDYRALMQQATKALTGRDMVESARDIPRRQLDEGRITLAPNANHTGVAGPVQLRELRNHVLELAGWQREIRGPSGSQNGPVNSMVAGVGFEPTTFGL